jgi:DNA primase
LYGHQNLFRETDTPLLVVEGAFDSMHLEDDSIACLGMPGDAQLEIMLEAKRPVVFALDGDAWLLGYGLAQRLNAAAAGQRLPVRFGAIRLPGGMDPDEFTPHELLDAARVSVDFHTE